MAAGERHHGFYLGTRKRAAHDSHRTLPVDHRGHPQFVINVSAFAEPADLAGTTATRQHGFAEKLLRTQHRSCNSAEATHESSSRPLQVECHSKAPFLCLLLNDCGGAVDFNQ